MKIAIIGYSGSGKSTMTKIISKEYNIPYLFLDTVNFKEGWTIREIEESRDIVKRFMKNDSWVIDGNYSDFLQLERLKQADRIIFLDFPRRICLYRAFKRYFENRNRTREDVAEGCIEKIDIEFIWWILHEGRNKNKKQHFENIKSKFNEKIVVLKNPKEVRKFLEYEIYK